MKTCKGCKHYKKDERIGIIVCEFGLHESYCEKDKEDFAIAELEKIRTEILSEYPQAESDKARLIGYGIHIALEFIDKHISELKGE